MKKLRKASRETSLTSYYTLRACACTCDSSCYQCACWCYTSPSATISVNQVFTETTAGLVPQASNAYDAN